MEEKQGKCNGNSRHVWSEWKVSTFRPGFSFKKTCHRCGKVKFAR